MKRCSIFTKVDPSEILSKDGLFSKLKKQLIERVLQSELEHELGYDKHSKKGKKSKIEVSQRAFGTDCNGDPCGSGPPDWLD